MEPDYDKILDELDYNSGTGEWRNILKRHFEQFEKDVRLHVKCEVLEKEIERLQRITPYLTGPSCPGIADKQNNTSFFDKCPQCTDTQKCNYCVRYEEET